MQRLWGLAAAATMMFPATGFAKGWELDDPVERLADLQYGINEVCLPAQRAGQTASQFEQANRQSLTLQRRRNNSNVRNATWTIGAVTSDVVVSDTENGCTVSTSFRADHADRLIPDLRGGLTERANGYQVVSGDPDSYRERLSVAFCLANASGGTDSLMLYEWVEPEMEAGRRQPRDILYISLVVPQAGFCASEQ